MNENEKLNQSKQKIQKSVLNNQSSKRFQKKQSNPQEIHKQTHCTSKWGSLQKARYLLFLIHYQKMLQADIDVQKIVWYSKLCQFIGCSTPQKCGDYHKSKLQKFGSIEEIINYLNDRVYMQKEEFTKECQRIKQITKNENEILIKKVQQFYAKKNKKPIEKMKFYPLVNEFKLRKQQIYKIAFLESENKNKSKKYQLPVQDLIIIQRETPFRYTNPTEQKKNIEKIIQFFKHSQQQIKSFKKLQLMQQSQELKQNTICNEENALSKQQNDHQDCQQPERKQKSSSKDGTLKFKRTFFWKEYQIRNLIIFLNIVKEKYRTEEEKQNLYKKCSEYLHTDKTSTDCKRHVLYTCEKYSGDFQKMLNQETKKLQISQQQIQRERQTYIFNEENPLKCEIRIQYEPIKQREVSKQTLQNKNKESYHSQYEVPLTLYFDFIRQNLIEIQQLKNPQHEENTEIESKVKHLFHFKVSNKVFTIIKNTAKDQIPSKQTNFIILIKRSKITFQSVEKQKVGSNQQKICEISKKAHQGQSIKQQDAINKLKSMKYNNLIIPIKRFPNRQFKQIKFPKIIEKN